MRLEVGDAREAVPAALAHVRLDARVHGLVDLLARLVAEAALAEAALVRLLAGVDAPVPADLALRAVRLAAEVARVRLDARVDRPVRLQRVDAAQVPAAFVTPVGGESPAVRLLVVEQRAAAHETRSWKA